MGEEISRGSRRRPRDSEYHARRKALKERLQMAVAEGDEKAFLDAISAYGLKPGDSEQERLLEEFRRAAAERGGPRGHR